MDFLLLHLFDHVEAYTILLTWIVVPLGFSASYLWYVRGRELEARAEGVRTRVEPSFERTEETEASIAVNE